MRAAFTISVVPKCKEFNVNGVRVYKRGANDKDILKALAEVLQENPLEKYGDYVFIKSHVSFGLEDGEISMMWSDRSRNRKGEDFSGHKEVKLI